MHQLLILRHAIALDREVARKRGLNDAERPLTDRGVQRMNEVAIGLKRLLEKPALVLSSPLLRARQTAEILASHYNSEAVSIREELSPGASPFALLRQMEQQQLSGPLVIVGHEPELSTLTGVLLAGKAQSFIRLKKAGAALLEFENHINRQSGSLRWLLEPKHLRRLAKC